MAGGQGIDAFFTRADIVRVPRYWSVGTVSQQSSIYRGFWSEGRPHDPASATAVLSCGTDDRASLPGAQLQNGKWRSH